MSVSDWLYAPLVAELSRVGIDTSDLMGVPIHFAAQMINERLFVRGMTDLPVVGLTSLPEALAMIEAHFGCQDHDDCRASLPLARACWESRRK